MHILPAIIAIFSGVTLLADSTAINLLKDTAFDAMPEASAWNYVGQPGWQVEKKSRRHPCISQTAGEGHRGICIGSSVISASTEGFL